MATDPRTASPLWWTVATAAFVVEIVLAVTVARATYRLAGGGPGGWVIAALATVALIAVWATWMSPKAPRRLPRAGRVLLGSALVLLAAALAHAAGLTAWAWWFGALGLAVIVVSQSLDE